MKKILTAVLILFMSNFSFAASQITNAVVPVSYFVSNAKQVAQIKDYLDQYKTASIVGLSGMGKTQLARMYARENTDNYDIIWFFDCNLDLNSEFLKLAKVLNKHFGAGTIAENASTARKDVMDYLSPKSHWLLVFDNLKIGANSKVKDIIEWGHNGDIIFGSQDNEDLPNVVQMMPFVQKDARILADNILENSDANTAEFLATEFKGYPILIVQGAQLLNRVKGLSLDSYRKKIQGSADKIKLNITLVMEELRPSAKDLLQKIALINNQAFSKEFLKIISENPKNIDDDIYDISKFALISIIDNNQENPTFEMHDVVAGKIAEINGDLNKKILSVVINQCLDSLPKDFLKLNIARGKKSVLGNFEIIAQNAEIYNVDLIARMRLNRQLMGQYNSYFNYDGLESLTQWLIKHDNNGELQLNKMDNDAKAMLAGYLQAISRYYTNRYSDLNTALSYAEKTNKTYESVIGYPDFKIDALYLSILINQRLGNIEKAQQNLDLMSKAVEGVFENKNDINFPYFASVALLYEIKGQYTEAFQANELSIEAGMNGGFRKNDLALTNRYVQKAQILNKLDRYSEAKKQVEQLLEMHKAKKPDHEVFGRILTQLVAAELGLGDIAKANEYADRAIAILSKQVTEKQDGKAVLNPDYADGLIVKGDILNAEKKYEDAIGEYKKAENIYSKLFGKNLNNDVISRLYYRFATSYFNGKNIPAYEEYRDLHKKIFGNDNNRTKELYLLNKKS